MTIELNQGNFEKEVLQSDIPVLVDFWAPWCGPCKALAPVLEKVSDRVKGKAKVAKINVDEHPDIAQQFNIRGIPTVISFWEGRSVDQIVGVNREERYLQALQLPQAS